MPSKTQFVPETILRCVALPQHGGRYAVIPHGQVIDDTRRELAVAGLQIKSEQYKTTKDGQIAQGIYQLATTKDPDMGMMFAWSNSYNKMLRFKCAIGGHVFVCMNGVVSGDIANFKRKHTGTALNEVLSMMQFQIQHAQEYFDKLIEEKEMLKQVTLSKRDQGALLGRLFAEEEILTLTQVGIVKREIDTPSFNYNANPDSAWSMYNHVTLALKDSHPYHYLTDHQRVHDFFVNEFGQLVNGQNDPVTQLFVPEEMVQEQPVVSQPVSSTTEESEFSFMI